MERTDEKWDKNVLDRIQCRISIRSGTKNALVPGSDSCNHARDRAGKAMIRLYLKWFYPGDIISSDCINCPVYLKEKRAS